MPLRFQLTRSRRDGLFAVALLFLLQSIAPAFQGAMARSAEGYTDIVCTLYGPRQVFVPLGDEPRQNPPVCHECPICILHASLDDQALLPQPASGLRTRYDHEKPIDSLLETYHSLHYSRYLSRAPPA